MAHSLQWGEHARRVVPVMTKTMYVNVLFPRESNVVKTSVQTAPQTPKRGDNIRIVVPGKLVGHCAVSFAMETPVKMTAIRKQCSAGQDFLKIARLVRMGIRTLFVNAATPE